MAPSLEAANELIRDPTTRALVSDLDGVLRVFDQTLWTELDAGLGLDEGASLRAVLGNAILHDVVRGRASFEEWRETAIAALVDEGIDLDAAQQAVRKWADTPAHVDQRVRSLLLEARSLGLEVLVLTNGTDRIRDEVARLDIRDVVGEDAEYLLSSHQIGFAKPERQAYEAAHSRLMQAIGTGVDPAQVVFLDDTARNVDAARQFGWRAVHHTTRA